MKVFWSWQSDTPGKIGRHFVRDALKAAIDELRQPEDVEEPTERDVKDTLHLDHDRQGVTGSPRLLETIFKKIDASGVFVGDVTPVATIPATSAGESPRPEKRIMNPNVAIELGYALKGLSELKVLMVLNEHYGSRQHLPFDIQGNAGPISYRLAPGATGEERRAEARKLKDQLVASLGEFVKQAAGAVAAPAFKRTPHTKNPAVFFDPGEVLARFGEDHDEETYGFEEDTGFYLRLMPRTSLSQPITRTALRQAFNRGPQMDTLSNSRDGGGAPVSNRFGAAIVDLRSPTNHTLTAITQAFPSGELWGFAPWALRDHGHGNKIVPWGGIERVVRRALPRYLDYAARLGVRPPFTIELGASGLEGRSLIWTASPDAGLGPYYDNEAAVSVVLNDASAAALDAALLKLFQDFCATSGYPRPPVVNGFPEQA